MNSATMTMTRRSLGARGAVLLGTGLTAACGPLAPPAGSRETPKLAPATLVFIDPNGPPIGDTITRSVERFMAQFPQVKVERVFGEGSQAYTKMQTMLAGATQLDAFWSWGYWKNAMAYQGVLHPFDEYLRREPKDAYVHTWSKAAADSARFAGKVYGWTTQWGVHGLYVNETLLERAGVPAPPASYRDPSWTLNRYLERARLLTRRSPTGEAEHYGSNMYGVWTAVREELNPALEGKRATREAMIAAKQRVTPLLVGGGS